MGKIFYGESNKKGEAKALANLRAKNYRRGVCFTPAKDKECVEKDGIWKCRAVAHHHQGSCGSGEHRSKNKSASEEKSVPEEYVDATEQDYAEVDEVSESRPSCKNNSDGTCTITHSSSTTETLQGTCKENGY